MSIYDIDYSVKSIEMTSPDKRFAVDKAFIKSLINQVQVSHSIYLEDYRLGVTAPVWNIATTYNLGDRVIYKGSVYVSLTSANVGHLPTDITYWSLYQINFIGSTERVFYNGKKIVLEYALNRWFHTTFRQPPAVSDIFIETNIPPLTTLYVGYNEDNSGQIFSNHSVGDVVYSNNISVFNNATINVPIAVYNALDPVPANRDKIIRAFADLYFVAGIIYNIVTY